MNLTLRPFQPSDFEALYRIDRACYEPGIAYSRRALREFIALPASRCWVACLQEEIVGFLVAHWEGRLGHVITIDVAPSARRRGTGSALLARAEDEMARGGVSRVDLETATNNLTAIAFWTRHGYRIFAIYPGYYMGRIDAYLMFKHLPSPGRARARPAERP